jgi:hypothetical protein
MVWAIKRDAVAEHQPYIRNELLCTIVTWIVEVGIWLGRIRRHELTFNSAEVHWVPDYARAMANVERNGSTGRKNAPASLSILSECIVDMRQKRCCKELIVDMLVPIGVGGAGVGLEEGDRESLSPTECKR